MRLIAAKPMTYGTRHMQAGEPFKASDADGAVLLAKGDATIPGHSVAPKRASAAEPERKPEPAASPRRQRRRGQGGAAAD